MKIDRLLGIITYLTNHEKVKAQQLAEKFEVSIRTIYRDIEAISKAGIPIATYQGTNGGIGIIEGFKLDKSILSNDEIRSIVTGLKSINSINEDIKIKGLIDKLMDMKFKTNYMPIEQEIMIDLSPWNQYGQIPDKIQDIKKAIQGRCIIEFSYFTHGNMMKRTVEPHIIVFKEASWYVYAFCLLRNDFRLFKLKRINELYVTDKVFTPREFMIDRIDWNESFNDKLHEPIELVFHKSVKHIVEEIFGVNHCERMQDEKIKVSFPCEQNDWLYGFLLSFGEKVEVVSPANMRNKIREIGENILKVYHK